MRRCKKILTASFIFAAGMMIFIHLGARAKAADRTNLFIVVTDAESGKPINQAHLTLQFGEPVKFGRKKPIAYSAKTNAQGKCKFPDIPKGPFRLLVTADDHQTFGKEFKLDRDDEVVEVKMKKPQPLL